MKHLKVDNKENLFYMQTCLVIVAFILLISVINVYKDAGWLFII